MPVYLPYTNFLIGKGKFFKDLRDGRQFPQAPHIRVRQQKTFGCEITSNFNNNGGKFRVGMQGIAYDRSEKSALVFIPQITKEKTWIPLAMVKIGTVPYEEDFKKWKIEASLSVNLNFQPATPGNDTVLSQSISALLQLFIQCPPSWLHPTQITSLGGPQALTRALIEGVKKAGLHDVLNNPNFKSDSLINAAAFKINEDVDKGLAGIYLRFYKSGKDVVYWKPSSFYLYTRMSTDLRGRWSTYNTGRPQVRTKHDLLRETADRIVMIPLCILNTDNTEFLHMAEQVFVCLLQTYRDDIFTASEGVAAAKILAEKPSLAGAIESAWYFRRAAETIASQTGWPGAVYRQSFGAYSGVKFSSPLEESGASFHEKLLWLRTDTWMMDKESGDPIPVTEFKRAKAAKAMYFDGHKSQSKFFRIFMGPNYQKEESATPSRMGILKTVPGGPDGINAPFQGATFDVIFEVRRDWKPHSQSFARLCSIGPYSNWDRANSWALRIQWEHPVGSGKYQHVYHQSRKSLLLLDRSQPGSFLNYAHGIRMVHWLFGETPNFQHKWAPEWYGSARVKQLKYDFLTQTISFVDPARQPKPPVSAWPRDPADILRQMKNPKYLLEGVGDDYKPRSSVKDMVCDTCRFKEVAENYPACAQIGDSKGCNNCKSVYGRDYCSWTPTLKGRGTPIEKMTPSQILQKTTIRAALIFQPHAQPTNQSIIIKKRNIADVTGKIAEVQQSALTALEEDGDLDLELQDDDEDPDLGELEYEGLED